MIKGIYTLKDGTVKTFMHDNKWKDDLKDFASTFGCPNLNSCNNCPFSKKELNSDLDFCYLRSFSHIDLKSVELIEHAELEDAKWYGLIWEGISVMEKKDQQDYNTLMRLVDKCIKKGNHLAAAIYLIEARKIREKML